jgi:hypothetical protein
MWDTFIEDMVILLKLWVVLWKKTALTTNNRGLLTAQRYTDPAVADREQDFDTRHWRVWLRRLRAAQLKQRLRQPEQKRTALSGPDICYR